MIQYALKCEDGHRFDSWFGSASAFDKLHSANMVTCALCGSTKVSKELMAPAVRPGKSAAKPADTPEAGPLSAPASAQEQMIADMRAHVESTSEYVGSAFATQARDMHEGTAEAKPIYGEAKLDDAKKLVEDGVPVLPLPFRPSGKSN